MEYVRDLVVVVSGGGDWWLPTIKLLLPVGYLLPSVSPQQENANGNKIISEIEFLCPSAAA